MTESIYNPNKRENAQLKTHHISKNFGEDGTYYLYGNGYTKGGKSCFTCTLPDCQWGSEKLYRRE